MLAVAGGTLLCQRGQSSQCMEQETPPRASGMQSGAQGSVAQDSGPLPPSPLSEWLPQWGAAPADAVWCEQQGLDTVMESAQLLEEEVPVGLTLLWKMSHFQVSSMGEGRRMWQTVRAATVQSVAQARAQQQQQGGMCSSLPRKFQGVMQGAEASHGTHLQRR